MKDGMDDDFVLDGIETDVHGDVLLDEFFELLLDGVWLEYLESGWHFFLGEDAEGPEVGGQRLEIGRKCVTFWIRGSLLDHCLKLPDLHLELLRKTPFWMSSSV